MSEIRIKCPHCRKETVLGPENPFRPFCSERCKMIDLGAWANEEYRVAAVEQEDEVEDGSESGEA